MKVSNMVSSKGNKVANQFILTRTYDRGLGKAVGLIEVFQSYDTLIAKRLTSPNAVTIYLDSSAWNYSVTTSKYRNQFLGETKKETQAKIDSGEYILTDLN